MRGKPVKTREEHQVSRIIHQKSLVNKLNVLSEKVDSTLAWVGSVESKT